MNERIAKFIEAVKDDPRVLGVTRRQADDECVLLLVTTWDGFESLPADLPRLGRDLLPAGPCIEQVVAARWTGLGVDGSRASLELRRAADLKPDRHRVDDEVLFDPREVVGQWLRCNRAAPSPPATPVDAIGSLLVADSMLRRAPRVLPQAAFLRVIRPHLPAEGSIEASVAARIDDFLRGEPLVEFGERRVVPRTAGDWESFLAVADDEGFKGDRVLFGEAVTRLRDLSKREPVFDQGFVVPTFDAVEAAFALGEAVGGCQPPLVPGVYVGVGVTPKDALEFWAAPFVRDPTCSVACVDDTGDRDVVERTAGREPMVASLTSVVDAAFDRLPALIDRARDATKESVDPAAVLATLHLPRSFVERSKRRGADALMCSRLTVALAVARAGHDCAPLVARKFGLAAGRVLANR
jgi:hypothetical protein